MKNLKDYFPYSNAVNESSTLPKILIVSGPTASGKSELAVMLAEKYGGEVVNADSMQVYSQMRIGTACPAVELLDRIPHHLFGMVSPDNNFTAADYSREARRAIALIMEKKKLPVVCGGTGLYIKVLLGGINDTPPADRIFRDKLTKMSESDGNLSLHQRLRAVDPLTANRLNVNDRVRIIRALEVYQQSGRPISAFHRGHDFSDVWCRAFKIGIEVERTLLYSRIEQRVDMMFANGLVDEVRMLLDAGYSPLLKSMSSIGYREVCEYLAGSMALPETIALVKRNTRRYAKRQLTWFRKDADMHWYSYPESAMKICTAVEAFLSAADC